MNRNGIITKGVGGAYIVTTGDGCRFICNARGVFRNRDITPVIGDYVEISINDNIKKTGTIHTIKPRRNELKRPRVANVDQVIVTAAFAQPPINTGLLDRYLLLAEYADIPVVICLNKWDLMNESPSNLTGVSCCKKNKSGEAALIIDAYEKAGYTIIKTSVRDKTGLGELYKAMNGKTSVFAGPSGVGKSSLINVFNKEQALETGEISARISRGKNTTRHTEIFPVASGFCVDTPGFTSLDIKNIPAGQISSLFREFKPFLGDCRFNDCRHDKEEGCAVKEQVGAKIHPLRYDSYMNLTQKNLV